MPFDELCRLPISGAQRIDEIFGRSLLVEFSKSNGSCLTCTFFVRFPWQIRKNGWLKC